MKDYKVGEFYNFWVKGLNGRIIMLEDENHDKFYVSAYDFQTEWDWASPKVPVQVLSCYVKGIGIGNKISLSQNRELLLKALYQEADRKEVTTGTFIVESIKQLGESLYYVITDAYGLQHKYRPKKKLEVQSGDEIELDIVSIKCNGQKSSLELRLHNVSTVTSSAVVDDSNTGEFGEETNVKEFKSTIIYPAGATDADIDTQMAVIVKTIAGFMNANGGTLYIGVNDNGDAIGIENEYVLLNSSTKDKHKYQMNKDGYENKIRSSMNYFLNPVAQDYVELTFSTHNEHTVCCVDVKPSNSVIWFDGTDAFKRVGNRTSHLRSDAIVKLVFDKAGISRPVAMQSEPVKVDKIDDVMPDKEDVNPIEAESATEVVKVNPPIKIQTKGMIKQGRGSYYINLFGNGDWSWSKEIPSDNDLEFCVPINAPTKTRNIIMVYADGCVNRVSANMLKEKKENKRYSNGRRNDGIELKKVFSATENDLLACYSLQNGHPFIKVHPVCHVSLHNDMHLNGNRLINTVGMNDVKMEDICFVPSQHYLRVSALEKTENQKASSLGFQMDLPKNATRFSQVEATLRSLCDIQGTSIAE